MNQTYLRKYGLITCTVALALGLLFGLTIIFTTTPVKADTTAVALIVDTDVDSIAGDGGCSLREAITAANSNTTVNECAHDGSTGADTITFAGNYTITLDGSQLPAITEDVTITGNGPANTIIQASTCDPTDSGATCTHNYRVFEVGAAGSMTLTDVTVQNGRCVAGCSANINNGGGIYNGGTLVINNSQIVRNKAADGGGISTADTGHNTVITASQVSYNHADGEAGGIDVNHPVTVTNSAINYNTTTIASGGGGAGIYVEDVPFLLENSDVISNTSVGYGGGMILYYGWGTIRNSRILSNTSAEGGGGIYVDAASANGGSVIVEDSEIAYNRSDVYGGGLVAWGDPHMMVTNSSFHHNTAVGDGGGMRLRSPIATITGTTFADNTAADNDVNTTEYGGGIYIDGTGDLSIVNSTFSDNRAESSGGGIYNRSINTEITNSTFSGNTADREGGAIYIDEDGMVITGTTFYTNSAGSNAGAIYQNANNTLVKNSTFSTNSATLDGGGLYNDGTLTMVNSTFYSNTAVRNGGGIYNNAVEIFLINNTFAANDAATGQTIYDSGILHISNNILASNSGSPNNCIKWAGSIATDINNLIEDNGTGGFECGTPVSTADPRLGPLQDNGGSTETMALLENSPAINAGDDTVCADAGTVNNLDQRGVTRSQGTHCDIGAYEVEATQSSPNFVVNTNADTDDGFCDLPGQGLGNQDCTLREAINAANANADASIITFAGNYTITLTSALPDITTEMTTDGSDQSVTISGNNTYRIFNVSAAGDLTVNNLTVANGSADNGGGIFNGAGTVTVSNSTVSGNSASNGGGIYNIAGTLTVSNSTFSGNSADSYGGGIINNGTVTVTNSTFSGNNAPNGGGIHTITTADLSGVILDTGSSGANCSGPIVDNGYNLSDDASCGFSGTSADNATLNLGPLADNGGDTLTHALLAGSPAIDVIPSGSCLVDSDQRGVARPQGAACDIGAYEVDYYALTVSLADNGNGSVSSEPEGIACGADCTESWLDGTVVTLTVVADTHYTFTGWAGACTGTNECVVTMDAAQNVTATFTLDTHLLTVNLAGSGNGTVTSDPAGISCEADCSESYDYGTVVTLTAVANTGSTFTGWSGACTNATGDCVVTMNAAQNVTATINVEPTQTGPNFVVNSNADTDDSSCDLLGQGVGNQDCTLREAINAANANADASIITFAANYTITLTSALPDITTDVTIDGEGAANTIVQASTCDPINLPGGCTPADWRVFTFTGGTSTLKEMTVRYGHCVFGGACSVYSEDGGNILLDTSATSLTVDAVNVQSGYADGYGGGITAYADLTIQNNSLIGGLGTGNQVGSGNNGGGVYFDRIGISLLIDNSEVSYNQSGGDAGGVYIYGLSATIRNGSLIDNNGSANNGGGMYADYCTTSLTVDASTISNNFAEGANGGGLWTNCTTTITNSAITGNSADTGGGIDNYGGSVSMTNSTVSGNEAINDGGGIYNYGGTLTMTISTLSGNSAVYGGGIYNTNWATLSPSLTISNSTFSGNEVMMGGGGIFSANSASFIIDNSTFSGNGAADGGGIYSNNSGSLIINNSTLSSNSTTNSGGGIYSNSSDPLTINNSTFSDNSTTNYGGGIENDGGTVTVYNSTFSGNSATNDGGGGGIDNFGGTVTVRNSIIADSTSGSDCAGSITSGGYNLDSDNTCGLNAAGDIPGTNPLLGPLADNGGDTWTHALLAGSPAIDAGDNAACAASPVNNLDQRGVTRPQGTDCDIGAFEAQAFTLTVALAGSGAGSVSGPGIACAGDCTEDFVETSVVTLTASADSDSTFTGWSGACTNTTGDCVLTMDQAKNVTATFASEEFTIYLPMIIKP